MKIITGTLYKTKTEAYKNASTKQEVIETSNGYLLVAKNMLESSKEIEGKFGVK